MQVRNLERIVIVGVIATFFATSAASEPAHSATNPTVATAEPDSQPSTKPVAYAGVIIEPLHVTYTQDFLSKDRLRRHRVEGPDLERIQRYYRETVTMKLSSHFAIATNPGSGVVRVDSILFNPVLDKRNWLVPARIVFRGAPQIQLATIVRDSQTLEVLDYIGISLKPNANRMMKDSAGFYWHFMRSVFDRIATKMRWSLEADVRAS